MMNNWFLNNLLQDLQDGGTFFVFLHTGTVGYTDDREDWELIDSISSLVLNYDMFENGLTIEELREYIENNLL